MEDLCPSCLNLQECILLQYIFQVQSLEKWWPRSCFQIAAKKKSTRRNTSGCTTKVRNSLVPILVWSKVLMLLGYMLRLALGGGLPTWVVWRYLHAILLAFMSELGSVAEVSKTRSLVVSIIYVKQPLHCSSWAFAHDFVLLRGGM